MRIRCAIGLAVSTLVVLQPVAGAEGDDGPLSTEVREMLDSGWETGEDALGQAAQHFQRANQIAPSDWRTEYGWILVLLKHRRYDDALDRLDAIVVDQPEHRTALMWRIRVKMLTRKFDAALVDMESLAAAIPAAEADPTLETKHLESLRFLGRMFGYLEGPVRAPPNLRERAAMQVSERLTEARRSAFESARREVVDRHQNLARRSDQTQADVQEQQRRERARQQAEIAAEHARIDMQQQRLAAERAEQRDVQDRQLAALEREAQQHDADLSAAETEFVFTVREIDNVRLEAAQLVAMLDVEGDPARRAVWGARLARAESELLRLQQLARRHEADAVRHRGRLAQVQQEAAETRGRYRDSLAELDQQESRLRAAGQQLLIVERKLNRQTRNRSPRAANLATRSRAFTTYEALPLEQEKQRILRALPQP